MFDSHTSFAMVRDDSPSVRPALLRPALRARRTLSEFLQTFGGYRVDALDEAASDHAVEFTGISLASLDVAPKDLFVALAGAHDHGARFAGDACAAGASAVLTDAAGAGAAVRAGLPTVVIDDPQSGIAAFSAWMYETDRYSPTLLGVTGTNGKTSTTSMLQSILSRMGVLAGLSTTVERRIGDRAVGSRLTTPEAPELHALLAAMREAGADAVALEVSAHGVSRGRVDGLLFDVVGFTNLSHDHLDEYESMEEYFDAKVALFAPEHALRGVVSLDTRYGARVQRRSRIPVTTISSRPEVDADWRMRVTDELAGSTAFMLTAPDGTVLESRVHMMGRHMAADAGLAIVMLVEAGFGLSAISRALGPGGLHVRIPGRSERISGDRGPLVLVDFSHNGAAFENTLEALRHVTTGALIMVVGADGNKDPSKRQHMGQVSADHSDVLIITDHHPRLEDPAIIRRALLQGAARASRAAEVHEIAHPPDAIRAAIALARPGDAILWAGPGMTDYRIVGADRVPYSPRLDARDALREAGWL